MTEVVARQGPVRTCVGCRKRAPATELLRVVVASGSHGPHDPGLASGPAPLVPDPRRRATGRGAWLHPDPACVDTAVRRRAFARALHVPGPIDPAPVVQFLARSVRQ